MNGACNGNLFSASPPGVLGRGQTVKYHLISISKSFKDFWVRPGGHFFFKHGHVAYQIDGDDDEQNRLTECK